MISYQPYQLTMNHKLCSWPYILILLAQKNDLLYSTPAPPGCSDRPCSPLTSPLLRCPVASLTYLPRAASSAFPMGGLLAGSLAGGCFWELKEGTAHQPHALPLEAGSCTDIQLEPTSRHCLVTYRPGEWMARWVSLPPAPAYSLHIWSF